MQLMLKSME